MVRLLTFACVIAVHSVALSTTGDNVSSNAVEIFLHFTRAAFFALTGFVLFHSNYAKPIKTKKFWKRRIPVVLIPYVVWTAIYFAIWAFDHRDYSVFRIVQRFGYDLITGSAQYHLYFLLVSLQIYALFPVLKWAVQKTDRWWRQTLAILALIDGAILAWYHFPVHSGNVGVFTFNLQEIIVTYLVYIFAGAYAAVHLDKFDLWVRRNAKLIGALFVVGLATAEVSYAISVRHGTSPDHAGEALQPAVIVWSLAMVLTLYLVGTRWASWRRPGRAANLVSEASRASFGVYLVHPLFLIVLGNLGFSYRNLAMPALLAVILGWVIAVITSAIFVELILRTKLALPLTGRRRVIAKTLTNERL